MSPDVSPSVFFQDAETVSADEYHSHSLGVGEAEHIDNVPQTGSGLFCEVCQTELNYSGRGRKPKRCDIHKRNASKNAERAPSSSAPRGLKKIEDDVTKAMFTLGTMISPYDQYDAAVLVSRAQPTGKCIATLAGRYPKFRDWMEKGGDGMMWVQVGMVAASVILPIGAHHGMIPMDERIAYKRFVDPNVE